MARSAGEIAAAIDSVRAGLPPGTTIVAAAKGRSPVEVMAAVEAGIADIGHNYVQEARAMREALPLPATWHLIGHLQRNKAHLAAALFDVVQTLDSPALAAELDRRCAAAGRRMPVLIEVNSGREEAKSGVLVEELDDLVSAVRPLRQLVLAGLMTMGPRFGDPEDARPFFRATRAAFDRLTRGGAWDVAAPALSMGMSNTYRLAADEGATMVRIGTEIFGPRGV